MCPIYGCPENFLESLATPTATFPEIVNGLFLQSIVLKCVQNLDFIGVPKKISAVPGFAHAHFSLKFFIAFCSDGPCEFTGHLKSVALPIPEILGVLIINFGQSLNTPFATKF